MVLPPQKKNALAKVAMATMCVSMSCTALAEAFPEKTGCEVINHSNYEQFMEKRSNVSVANPFKPETCVKIDYDADYNNKLSVDDFGGNKNVLDYFESFQDRKRTRVDMVMDYDTKSLYTMLQFNTDEMSIKQFKRLARGEDISVFMDELVFLHEMMHFDPSVTLNTSFSVPKREMISDITALLMLKSKHDLSMPEFFEITESLFNVREKAHKMAIRGERNKKRRNRKGNHDHYDEDLASNIESFLSYIKDNKIDIRVTTLNEAREVAMHIIHNYQGSEMVDHESKTMTVKNDQYRQAFFEMEPGEQMVYYERNKPLMGGELLTMFEDLHTLLPAEQKKLDNVAPEIIKDASQYFHAEVQEVANEYLASMSYDNVELTASISIDNQPTLTVDEQENNNKNKGLSMRR